MHQLVKFSVSFLVYHFDLFQETLLHHLGIGLNSTTEPWPLQVRPRALAVLAEVLLLRQQTERDATTGTASAALPATKRGSEMAVMQIWIRLTTALADAAVSMDVGTCAADVEDINVEHLQLVTFLFHSTLTLMQKKSLWLQLCQAIVRIAESLTGRSGGGSNRLSGVLPLPLTRLLLIVDYLLHYFYDMPPSLVEQVYTDIYLNCASLYHCIHSLINLFVSVQFVFSVYFLNDFLLSAA
jgi:E3 ubiquitin-protein ligase UBR4